MIFHQQLSAHNRPPSQLFSIKASPNLTELFTKWENHVEIQHLMQSNDKNLQNLLTIFSMFFDFLYMPYQTPNPVQLSNAFQEMSKNLQMTLKQNKQLNDKVMELSSKLQKAQKLNKQMEQELQSMQESVQKFKKRKYIRKIHQPEMFYRCQINGCNRVYTSKTALVSHFRKKHEKK